MRLISFLFGLLVAGAVVLFAIANRHTANLEFWPLPLTVETPVYLAVLGSLFVGVLAGLILAWAAAAPARARNRAARRRLAALEREVETLRAEAALPATVAAAKVPADADPGVPPP